MIVKTTRFVKECDYCHTPAPDDGKEFARLYCWISRKWGRLVPRSRRKEVWCLDCWKKLHPNDIVTHWLKSTDVYKRDDKKYYTEFEQ